MNQALLDLYAASAPYMMSVFRGAVVLALVAVTIVSVLLDWRHREPWH